jgi:gamma-glutamylcysteine synthetase
MGEKKRTLFYYYALLKPMKQGVHYNMALPFALKSILRRQKKNYENSNSYYFTMQKYNLQKKSSKRNQKNPLKNIIITL